MYRRIVTTSILLCGILCILAVPQQSGDEWDHPRFFFSAGWTTPAQQAESDRSEPRPSSSVTAATAAQTKKHVCRMISTAAPPPREGDVQRTDPSPLCIPLFPHLFRFPPRAPPSVC